MPDLRPQEIVPLPHPNLSVRYVVSKDGNILSLFDNKNRRRPAPLVRQVCVQRNGYASCYVSWTKPDVRHEATVWVHQMVCQAFHGPKPSGLHQVAHLDGNPLNNMADNLKWVTRIENESHKKLHGTAMYREKNHQAKIDTRMAKAIVYLHSKHKLSFAELGRAFGVKYQTIQKIIKKPTWTVSDGT